MGSFKADATIKAMIIGGENVGKTQITNNINDELFDGVYKPTIGIDFRLINIGF